VNDDGQYAFERFVDLDPSDLVESRSLWEMRLGFGFRF
jgi:hypothetical protein